MKPFISVLKQRHAELVLLLAASWVLVAIDSRLIETISSNNRLTDSYLRLSEPQPGRPMPTLKGMTLEGKQLSLPVLTSRPSLLLVFSPFCLHSKANWPQWQILLSTTPNVDVMYIDLSSQVTQEFAAAHAIVGSKVLTKLSTDNKTDAHLNATPQTILLGQDGIVRRVWTGELTTGTVGEIKSLLHPSYQ